MPRRACTRPPPPGPPAPAFPANPQRGPCLVVDLALLRVAQHLVRLRHLLELLLRRFLVLGVLVLTQTAGGESSSIQLSETAALEAITAFSEFLSSRERRQRRGKGHGLSTPARVSARRVSTSNAVVLAVLERRRRSTQQHSTPAPGATASPACGRLRSEGQRGRVQCSGWAVGC